MGAVIRPKAEDAQSVRQEQANAVHALSQVAFADARTAIATVGTPGESPFWCAACTLHTRRGNEFSFSLFLSLSRSLSLSMYVCIFYIKPT